tara:strand:- start:51584 stop:51754 length:171 start_codon:yes stop_codon:yes gene_type:complete
LICPDGVPNGRVSDAIDVDLINYVMNLIDNWLSFDTKRQYALGLPILIIQESRNNP